MRTSDLPIQRPCGERWDAMDGDDQRRHCQVCDKDVIHLSGMSRAEAEAALGQRRGQRVCVRYAVGPKGELLFQEPPARQPLLPASLLLRGRRLAAGAGLATMLAACVPSGPVGGAMAGRAVSGEVAERLGQGGTCEISLEPLIPLTLKLHAAACGTSTEAPVAVLTGEAPVAPERAPAPEPEEPAPPSKELGPARVPMGRVRIRSWPSSAADAAKKKEAREKRRAARQQKPVAPRELMGDIAL